MKLWKALAIAAAAGVGFYAVKAIRKTGQAPVQPAQRYLPYVVKGGDTLSAIAARFRTTVSELARVNRIQNPDRIYAGQIIQVPVPLGEVVQT